MTVFKPRNSANRVHNQDWQMYLLERVLSRIIIRKGKIALAIFYDINTIGKVILAYILSGMMQNTGKGRIDEKMG